MPNSIPELQAALQAALKSESMYALRYTQDLYVLKYGQDWKQLIPSFPSDYLLHIVCLGTDKIMWQNGRSERYGKEGLEQ